jgi:hypothetical protein
MDWILVVITFMNPHVDLKTVETYHPTEEACQQTLELLEERFSKIEGLGFILSCHPDEDHPR